MQVDLTDIRDRLDQVALENLSEDLQIELGKLHKIIGRIEKNNKLPDSENEISLRRDFGIILNALNADEPNLKLARDIRYDIKMRTKAFGNKGSSFFMSKTGGSSTAIVLLGLICGLAGWSLFLGVLIVLAKLGDWTLPALFTAHELETLIPGGILGAMVSIVFRLRGNDDSEDLKPSRLFLGTMFRPFLGIVIGLVAYAAIESGTLFSGMFNLEADDETKMSFYFVLGFTCGFSERIASGITRELESKIAK